MKWAHKKSGMAFSGDFFSVDPARAGMILRAPSPDRVLRGPRASGDDPIRRFRDYLDIAWTPRERG